MRALAATVSRRWRWSTIVVILGMIFLVRLGIWQLDRHQQRQAIERSAASSKIETPFVLSSTNIPADIRQMGFRRIEVTGTYDFSNQIVLKNRFPTPSIYPSTQLGAHLITPLLLGDDLAVLVDRGWVPFELSGREFWPQFEEPLQASFLARGHESQPPSEHADGIAGDSPQAEWFRVDIEAIRKQMPYEILPFFLVHLPEPDRAFDALPLRHDALPPSSQVSHLGYAMQWFMFALILGFSYIQYIRLYERRLKRLAEKDRPDAGSGPVAEVPTLSSSN